MSDITISAANAKAQDSHIYLSQFAGRTLKVASAAAGPPTTVTVDDSSDLTGTALYTATEQGMLVVIRSAAGTGNHGMTANISDITSDVLTVDVDFATGGELADGDLIAVIPPLSVELFTNGGHTMALSRNMDNTKAFAQTFDTHNTPISVGVGGNVPIFATIDDTATARILAAGIGSYQKTSTGQHDYIPLKSGVSGYTDTSDFCLVTKDGNGVLDAAWYGLFGTTTTITVPENGVCTISLDVIGAGAVREIGGTGKTFPEAASEFIDTDIKCSLGDRFTSRGARVQLGGTYNAAFTDSVDRYTKNLTITINRGAIDERVLASQFPLVPEEMEHSITISGTRVFENDDHYEKFWGASTDAEPGTPQETRFLAEIFDPAASATKLIKLDVPRGIFEEVSVTRQNGLILQEFTYRGLHTLDSDGCVASATPLYRARFLNGVDTDYSAAV